MTCREFTEFIAEFLDGELPSAERQAFADPDGSLPADVPDELADAIRRARRSGSDNPQR